ncbi:MAG: adenine phosphoribosyltransferase [Thermoplasmatota archaeon]
MDRDLSLMIESFRDIPIVRIGDYDYFVHPLSDGIPEIRPDLLSAASVLVSGLLPESDGYDILLTVESMGIPITTAVSSRVMKPYSIVRKRKYGLPGEIGTDQMTGYSFSELHLNLPRGGGRAVLLDDVLSTGGTLKAVSEAASRSDWKIVQAIFLFNKMGDERGRLAGELGFPLMSVLDLEYRNGRFEAAPSVNMPL